MEKTMSMKRPFAEVTSAENNKAKRSKLESKPTQPEPGATGYDTIFKELPRIKSRVQRYTGELPGTGHVLPAPKPLPGFPPHAQLQYQPLIDEEIRLLKIFPGVKTDPLRGALVHAPLTCVVDRYEALSYVWGSSGASETIELQYDTSTNEGKSQAIQANLFAALRQLRQENEEVVIWADALCINQTDIQERSKQVRRMADIYRHAANVIVWLGESSIQSRAAMRTISAMLTPGFFSKIKSYDWNDVHALLQNEWFSRRWVVQEIVSAKSATVLFGEDQVDWRDFSDAVELFETNIDDISKQLRTSLRHKYDTDPLGSLNHSGALELIRTTKQIMILSRERLKRPQRNLEWLLTCLKAFQTADARDTVYAFLAIAADGGSITPDYKKTLLEVVMDVVTHVIHESSSLDILLRHWLPVGQDISTTSSNLTTRSQDKSFRWFDNNFGADTSRYYIFPTYHWQEVKPLDRLDVTYNNIDFSNLGTSVKSQFVTQTGSTKDISSHEIVSEIHTTDKSDMVSDLIQSWLGGSGWPQGHMPSWIRSGDGLPFGDPRARSIRRINGNPLVGLPGEGHYNATKGKAAQIRFGKRRDVFFSLLAHSSGKSSKKLDKSPEKDPYNGVLYAKGVELGEITDLSARMADGIALQECLEMGGFSLRNQKIGQDVPDRLWRTLVAGRDSHGRPATSLCRLAFLNLATEISEHRSIDPGELLSIKLDPYIRNFVARMEEVVWNRRIFKGKSWKQSESGEATDEELFGLAPQNTRIGDKICLLYGCSVPVVLRESRFGNCMWPTNEKCYEIVGEAYVDGFMDGEAFELDYEELDGQAQEFALC